MRRTRAWALGPLALFLVVRGLAGCSPTSDEHLGTSRSAMIMPAFVNSPIAFTANHETSVAHITDYTNSTTGRWVGVSNNNDTADLSLIFSWMYSTNGNGDSWTFANITDPFQFGCPGNVAVANCFGGGIPCNCPQAIAANGVFSGWGGDVSIAAVTDPEINNFGRRVIAANLATNGGVFVALSDDGGQSWGNLRWVDDGVNGNSLGVDQPFIFSNPTYPYGTYVSWVSDAKLVTGKGHLRKIQYNLDGSFSAPAVIDLNKNPNDTFVAKFNFGIASQSGIPACAAGPEIIYYVYANGLNVQPRCARGVKNRQDKGTTTWSFGIVDGPTQAGQSGPWPIVTDAHFSECAGLPTTAAYTNSVDPHIAVDPTNSWVWVTHTRQTTNSGPVRTNVESAQIGCPLSTPPTLETVFQAPNPCGGCTAADNWLPGIAMNRLGGNRRVGVYWYGTNNSANTHATLYMAFQENGIFSAPVAVLAPFFPVTSGTSWTLGANNIDMYDYQTLGTSWTQGSFLALWALDRRPTQVIGWNGGFETGSLAAPPGPDWVGAGPAYSITSVDRHSGNYALQLGSANPTNGSSVATQIFKAPHNAKDVSIWWKSFCSGGSCPDTVAFDWVEVILCDNNTSTCGDLLPAQHTYNLSIPWHRTNPTLGPPIVEGHMYTITLINHDDNIPGNALYTFFDDLNFSPVASSTDTAMMSNLAQ